NGLTGFSTDAEITASLTQELDNGLSVSAEVTFAADEGDDADELSYGSISLSSDTAGITFGTDLHGAAFSAVSDTIAIGDGDEGVSGINGYVMFGETTVFLSMPIAEGQTDIASEDIEIGVTSVVGGWTVGLGYANDGTNSDVVVQGSGSVAGADLTVTAGQVGGETAWDVDASYPVGPVTLGATFDSDEAWEVSVGYAEGAVAVDAAFDSDEDWSLEASYDMGNGLVAYAGIVDAGDDYYVGGAYDLGGGASFYASYVEDGGAQNGDNEIGANDYARGTTVGLSFEF
ncbi:porin, partial [Flavimaricola sp.]